MSDLHSLRGRVALRLSTIVIIIFFASCVRPLRSFKNITPPSPPDYSMQEYWAALPWKKDSADFQLKRYGVKNNQRKAKVDVFFIYPTNYLYGFNWNVNLDDSAANKLADTLACKLEASVFNGSCKVYVPRYRSANLMNYFDIRKKSVKQAADLAYSDIRAAFIFYMNHYNKARPIIIASHSQGTDYGIELMKEFFDKDTSLNKKLVAAYLIGRPIYDTTFKFLKVMDSAEQIGGYVTWNSVGYHTNTFYGNPVGTIIGVNPLSWKRDTTYVPQKFNKGALPGTAKRIDVNLVDAKLAPSGFLWIHAAKELKKEYPGTSWDYYHKCDYLFFYMNIRENVKQRIDAYYRKQKK